MRNNIINAISDQLRQTANVVGKRNLFIYIFLAIVVTVSVGNRILLPFQFPIPWNDETAFIAQALSFSETGSLFTYGLNAERDLMWMPPGYMLFLAAFYKIFGYSYDLSRWLSLLCYLGIAFFCTEVIRKELKGWHRIAALAAFLITFLSPYMLVMSNVARMDALYTLFFIVSLVLAINQRYVYGFSLVIVSSLVHFNAIYFLLPYCYYIIWLLSRREPLIINPLEIISLIIAGILFFLYLFYIKSDINGFLADMKFQFKYKDSFGPAFGGTRNQVMLLVLIGIGIVLTCTRSVFFPHVIVFAYATSFIMLGLNGRRHMWYEFSYPMSAFLFTSAFLMMHQRMRRPIFRYICVTVIAVSFLTVPYFAVRKGRGISIILPKPEYLGRPFIDQNEIERVRRFILSLPADTKVTFGYSGVEPFFIDAFMKSGAIWTAPFKSMTELLPLRDVDYIILCDSSMFPKSLTKLDFKEYKRECRDTGCLIKKVEKTDRIRGDGRIDKK